MQKLFFLISFALLTGSTLLADRPLGHDYNNPESLEEQLINYLDDIDLSDIVSHKKIYVDFMLNTKGEIMVLSTNNDSLDEQIKNKLNYKKPNNHGLEYKKLYTLPITFIKD